MSIQILSNNKMEQLENNWKKYDFLAYNRDFSHEIPPLIFAPPSARRNFFKCAPSP